MKLKKNLLSWFVKRMLSPVVKLCLDNAYRFQDFEQALREVYINQAKLVLTNSEKKESISRLSILTGLTRREVKKFNEATDIDTRPESLTFKIIGAWQSNPKYSKKGKPRSLSVGTDDSEFNQLVYSISKDLNPATILFELERLNLTKTKNNKVHLENFEFIPEEDLETSLAVLTDDNQDLVNIAVENIFQEKDLPNLHRRTMYDNIDPEKAEELKKWLITEGLALHKKARTKFSKYDLDINPKANKKGVGVKIVLSTFGKIYED